MIDYWLVGALTVFGSVGTSIIACCFLDLL